MIRSRRRLTATLATAGLAFFLAVIPSISAQAATITLSQYDINESGRSAGLTIYSQVYVHTSQTNAYLNMTVYPACGDPTITLGLVNRATNVQGASNTWYQAAKELLAWWSPQKTELISTPIGKYGLQGWGSGAGCPSRTVYWSGQLIW